MKKYEIEIMTGSTENGEIYINSTKILFDSNWVNVGGDVYPLLTLEMRNQIEECKEDAILTRNDRFTITMDDDHYTIFKHQNGNHYLNIDGHEDYVEGISEEELTNYIWENQTDAYSQDIAKHIKSVWQEINGEVE